MITSPNRAWKWISTGAILSGLALPVLADSAFLGLAAGDATDTSVVLWTRHDPVPVTLADLAVLVSTSPDFGFAQFFLVSVDSSADYTGKVVADGLAPSTRYYYKFVDYSSGDQSGVGTFKTAP